MPLAKRNTAAISTTKRISPSQPMAITRDGASTGGCSRAPAPAAMAASSASTGGTSGKAEVSGMTGADTGAGAGGRLARSLAKIPGPFSPGRTPSAAMAASAFMRSTCAATSSSMPKSASDEGSGAGTARRSAKLGTGFGAMPAKPPSPPSPELTGAGFGWGAAFAAGAGGGGGMAKGLSAGTLKGLSAATLSSGTRRRGLLNDWLRLPDIAAFGAAHLAPLGGKTAAVSKRVSQAGQIMTVIGKTKAGRNV